MAKQTFTTGQVLTAAQMTSLQQTAMGGGAATAKTTSYVLVAADAGTTVAMDASGSTTITVNTGLFSAGDSVFIQNRGAGTTTVTAGTATVTTHGSLALAQWEGGQLYFTSSSAAIFFDISQSTGMTNPMTTTGDTIYSSSGSTPARLGIGATGNVLTVAGGVPTWAAPAGGGKVLQVVQDTDITSYTNTSSSYSDTGLSVSITPSSVSSRILVFASMPNSSCYNPNSSSDARGQFKLVRDSTQLMNTVIGVENFGLGTDKNFQVGVSFAVVDSPATTSSTTYKIQGAKITSGSQIGYSGSATLINSIIVMEIGA